MNLHVELCLRKSESNGSNRSNGVNEEGTDDDDDASIDVEGESYEEYEWAGQTRIRVSSLLEGGYSATGLVTSISNSSNNDAEDEDLNVDGDDSQVYGSPQYTERDIILPLTDDKKKENVYLRNLVIGQTTADVSAGGRKSTNGSSDKSDSSMSENVSTESVGAIPGSDEDVIEGKRTETTPPEDDAPMPESRDHIIEALKEKIREYEIVIKNKSKCLICMDEFRIPVVSICCWHVHCEECWLRTLGARKLCPQCNMITSPTDLRRIYM